MELCGVDQDECFFDAREEVTSMTDWCSECPDASCSSLKSVDRLSISACYEVWIRNLESVEERRNKFLSLMGWGLDRTLSVRSDDFAASTDVDRITESSGAVLRTSCFGDGFSSTGSSVSTWSNECHISSVSGYFSDNARCRIRNLDNGSEFVVNRHEQDATTSTLREVGSNSLFTVDEFQSTLDLSPFVQNLMRREVSTSRELNVSIKRRRKKSWLRRLGSVSCVMDRQWMEAAFDPSDTDSSTRDRSHRVRVRSYKKRSKEFSAVFQGQEIEAHVGPIFTMKFSPDGQYLASAGEDGVVRVWQVRECESSEDHVLDSDPSCICFMVNQSKELTAVITTKEKLGKIKAVRKKSDSACVIMPPKVFQLSEKPLHEFHGHRGDVLDLSWSKSKNLLSSSVDGTVRLWRIGHDGCLKIFSHNNYVTCVQFNPVDENYFISGSIDGKVRIWAISGCHVVDWTDIREIVTAVCYRPDGQGGLVGSMAGICRFYDASGNHLQLDAQISLQGKKKSASHRITGFQFSPSDPRKVIVTSADSQVRVLDGIDIISKYKGIRNTGSQISASFTSDGKHIISASEDSNVYIWNYRSPDGPAAHRTKSVWSCERFVSSNVSVAISWSGMKPENYVAPTSEKLESCAKASENHATTLDNDPGVVCSDCSVKFSLSHGFFTEPTNRGSATWPEEKLPAADKLGIVPSTCKSHYKFLKACCQNSLTSNAWGLVIVTAGWDGRIRSFFNYGLPVRF